MALHTGRIRGPPALTYDPCHTERLRVSHPMGMTGPDPDRKLHSSDLVPSSLLPAAYYGAAHAAFLMAALALVIDPTIPGASFYHPRMVALVHIVTLGWITGSILGSFYIVGPVALRIPMQVRTGDWLMFAAFPSGTAGMVVAFWVGRYEWAGWSAALVMMPIAWVAMRAAGGLRHAAVPRGVTLHVALAFFNILVAAGAGLLLAFNRTRGFLEVSPLALVFAHAHVAVVGWGAMMVVGLAYRLIPMIVPSAMPAGPGLARSAILIQSGLVVLVAALLYAPAAAPLGALAILAGFGSFASHMRASVKRRLPRPPALPRRDWSTWQAHAALLWLLVAALLGLALSLGVPDDYRLGVMWLYGTAGIVGFLGQIVTGIQGRLVPFYAWYRAMALIGHPPERAANSLPSAAFARAIFLAWTAGVPLLAVGLAVELTVPVRLGAACLVVALLAGAAYLRQMLLAATLPPSAG